jgi:hypothetical protein
MEKITYPGLLQPLSIPKITWKDNAMDFIEILIKSWRNDIITVIIYKFIKYRHFITLAHTLIYILKVAQISVDHFYKFHGLATAIVTYRDKVFTSLY